MQRYDTYKDSGVKWLGEIPSHWESIPLKKCFISSESGLWGDDPKQNDDDAICIRVADFDYSKFSIKTEHLTLRSYGNLLSENKKLTKGDLLLEKSGGGELFPVGRVVRFNLDLGKTTCSNFIQKLSPSQKYCSSFLCYLLSTMYTKKVNGLFYNQTTGIQNLKIKEYLNQTVFLPPLEEQTAIAAYLDTATSKIDAAIAQQQKMIELLNERKQIIINRAVTKGLNPNAKMKDSGVEWIGEVPEHWDIRKLGTIGSTINGVSHDSSYFGEGEPFVNYSDVYKNYSLPKSVSGLAKSSIQERMVFSVEKGDVFFTRTSETAEEIGFTSTCLETIPNAVFAGFLIRFRPQAGILDPNFSMYYFRAHIHRSYFVKEMNLVIRASLSQQLLRGLPVLLPPLQEQCNIANYLKREINEIDLCLNSKMKQISLLQERKQIIINEVVTGKVKVV